MLVVCLAGLNSVLYVNLWSPGASLTISPLDVLQQTSEVTLMFVFFHVRTKT